MVILVGGFRSRGGFAWQDLSRVPRTALAVVGSTIQVRAFFGLFGISRGLGDREGGTVASPEQELWQVPSRRRP